MKTFDAIVIGAGQAGPFLAARMASAGKSVALIERKYLGGTCVNSGCMPTKTLVASAKAVAVARQAANFGVVISGHIDVDMPTVAARAYQVTADARSGLESWLSGLDRLEVIYGQAKFVSPKTITVGGELVAGKQIFINVGARPSIPPIPGLDEAGYLTSTSIIQLKQSPRHLIILGGSYIGLEFAQMYRRFGSEITIVERGPQIAAREDVEVSEAIADALLAEGITLVRNSQVKSVLKTDGDIIVTTDSKQITGSHLLVALGRRPNTDDLGLAEAGVEVDGRGYIKVDDQLRTTAEDIWALGDCNGHGGFTHTAYNDFEIVAANLLDGERRKISERVLGYALYIDPPLGRVGLTERQAREAGYRIKISVRPMTRVGRAVEKGETRGLMKLVVDADTDHILGAAIFGVGGDEAIHSILSAMNLGATAQQLRWAVPIHPTVAELVPTLISDLL